MAVRSANLAVGTAPTSTVATAATCPAGETWIIKDVRVYSATGTPRAYVGVARGSLQCSIVDESVPGPGSRGLECWVVLEPGDSIEVYSQTNTSSYWVSGAMLVGVA